MKILFSCFLVLVTLTTSINAQEIDAAWSERQIYENKKDGFFDEFVGSNSKYVYATFSNLTVLKNRKLKKLKIVMFDKTTMDKVADETLFNRKEEKSNKKYEGLEYYRTVIFEKLIYVFWVKESKAKSELYVQSYDANLNKLNPLKKVYELGNGKKGTKSELFVMSNKRLDEKIIIGGEVLTEPKGNIKLEYKVLNSDFSFATSSQVILPVKNDSKYSGLSSSYELGDDGNLHIKSYVTIPKEERKQAKKNNEETYFPVYSTVNLQTGEIQSYPIKFDDKRVFNFDIVVTNNTIKLFGFFCDKIKDPKGRDTHGIYYSVLDPKTFAVKSSSFSAFTKKQLDDLFAKDKEDRKDRKLIKSKKKADSENLSIASNYEIENVQSVDEENVLLFCSRMRNYTVTSCDGKGHCQTKYYCEKSNVTVFKVAMNGTIVWASNLDRRMTYSGWDIYDLAVMNRGDNFYVAYGSQYGIMSNKKNFRNSKSKRQISDRFEYAVFDYKTGNYKKYEYKVNPSKAKKSERKTIEPYQIQVIDNEFYTNSTNIRIKPAAIIVGCVGGIVCFPLFAIPLYSGNARKGDGYLGKITPLK